ncbi:MAG: sigma-70 family RNA polymerase sigma factor [Oscillospiraceae bacterium]|nr:sigma-70 family RNA polymerase sigma factor [Oscillospiraceae bacterium]
MSNQHIALRFDEIYNSTHRSVLAYITSKCSGFADIQDIFQETYLELYQILNKRGADYITDEKALLFRLAKQKIANSYSLLKRLQVLVKNQKREAISEIESEVDESALKADPFLTEEYVVNQILLESVRKYINSKPDTVKKVFYLFYDLELSIPEIAEKLSLTESDVKNKIYRTIKQIRKQFLNEK